MCGELLRGRGAWCAAAAVGAATRLSRRVHAAACLQQTRLRRLAGIKRLHHARVRFVEESLEACGG